MKFGILSDLHMEFGVYNLEPEHDVFYLNAGDTDSNSIYREKWLADYTGQMFTVLGNHDYYSHRFDEYMYQMDFIDVGGVKIAGATLWTDLSNPIKFMAYREQLVDARHISGLTYEAYNEAHQMHRNYLLESEADIIVSHHAPSYQSIHEKYRNSENSGFYTELTNHILDMKKPPKLWVHGHVHTPFDYMIGETRVICWPRGYPNENSYYKEYKPRIVEL